MSRLLMMISPPPMLGNVAVAMSEALGVLPCDKVRIRGFRFSV
jgi:hypothetical protein